MSDCNNLMRITKVVVVAEGLPIFSEMATSIFIDDEAGGEFVKVSQIEGGYISIDVSEWPAIRKAIDYMIKKCVK